MWGRWSVRLVWVPVFSLPASVHLPFSSCLLAKADKRRHAADSKRRFPQLQREVTLAGVLIRKCLQPRNQCWIKRNLSQVLKMLEARPFMLGDAGVKGVLINGMKRIKWLHSEVDDG